MIRSKSKSTSGPNSRKGSTWPRRSSKIASNIASRTATITRPSPRGSSVGATTIKRGAREDRATRGRLSADGSNLQRWELQRFGVVRQIGGSHDVFLDFDTRRVPRLYPLWRLARLVGVCPVFIETFRTRKGWHVWIRLRETLTNAERVAFQACAGSDPRREELNLMRVIAIRRHDPGPFWRQRWNLLFERKIR